jgi:hypothetical protein
MAKGMQAALIAGDREANSQLAMRKRRPTWDESFLGGFSGALKAAKAGMDYRKEQANIINNRVAKYIDALDTNVDISALTGNQQKAITDFLVKNRNEYAELAGRIARIEDPSSEEYLNIRDRMNGISLSFENLAVGVKSYKDDKALYLKEFDNGMISEGNELGVLNESSKLYTNEASFNVGEGGGLQFWDPEKETYKSYSQMPKPFTKDYATADEILKMSNTLYNAGYSLDGARANMVRQKIANMIGKGGRKTLLSLASDDFIMEGGLGLQDPSLFAPENEDALRSAVVDSYMSMLTDVAKQGAANKRPGTVKGGGGFTGAIKDEINISLQTTVPEAMQFAQYALAKPEQKPQAIKEMLVSVNSIDPTRSTSYISRADFYNEYLEGMDIEDNAESTQAFIDDFGNYDIYQYNAKNPQLSKPLALDINDAQQLYAFYLKNAGLSTKAANYHLGQYNNYLNQLKKNSSSKASPSGSGAYDNL